jgi:hypothetical protein
LEDRHRHRRLHAGDRGGSLQPSLWLQVLRPDVPVPGCAACRHPAHLSGIARQVRLLQGYYAPQTNDLVPLLIENALDLFGWEFLFRGFLIFALYPVCGPYAILLQAVPFTIAHFGKPQLETLSCIFGGSLFGYVAWRTRSFLYPFLIHWYLATVTILFAAGVGG